MKKLTAQAKGLGLGSASTIQNYGQGERSRLPGFDKAKILHLARSFSPRLIPLSI
jgi:hypothetical protein